MQSVKVIETDARRVAPGQHRSARRRTHGRTHIEVRKAHALGGQRVYCRRVVHFRAIASEIAVAEVITVDQDDVGAGVAYETFVSTVIYQERLY